MSRYLIKLPQFLKPFFIELKDTTIFILSDIFNYIKGILPKKQMIYSWTFKRTIPNFKRYFLLKWIGLKEIIWKLNKLIYLPGSNLKKHLSKLSRKKSKNVLNSKKILRLALEKSMKKRRNKWTGNIF